MVMYCATYYMLYVADKQVKAKVCLVQWVMRSVGLCELDTCIAYML